MKSILSRSTPVNARHRCMERVGNQAPSRAKPPGGSSTTVTSPLDVIIATPGSSTHPDNARTLVIQRGGTVDGARSAPHERCGSRSNCNRVSSNHSLAKGDAIRSRPAFGDRQRLSECRDSRALDPRRHLSCAGRRYGCDDAVFARRTRQRFRRPVRPTKLVRGCRSRRESACPVPFRRQRP